MFGSVTFIVALCAMMICQAGSARLPAPTNLSAEWIDNLTVKLSWSWKRPEALRCEVLFNLKLNGKEYLRTNLPHYLDGLLTESSAKWNYTISTVAPSCSNWESSSEEEIVVEAPKPSAEVTDFKCYLSSSDMDCSWIPNPKFSPLSLSYRDCGTKPEILKQKFKQCNQIYHSGPRRVCHLKGNFLQKDLCMVATSPNGNSTFKAPKALRLPNEMKISEEGTYLVLTLMPLEVQISSSFYHICYSACDKPSTCVEHTVGNESRKIPYDKSCQYKFRYQARTVYSTEIYSDWSEEMVYGSTDRTLTVVAIVIPIIVSFCVILSCICFRRHKDIICPDVPDPSAIFKEMINGNKEMKPKVHTYAPVQEPIEPVIIVPHIPPSSRLVST